MILVKFLDAIEVLLQLDFVQASRFIDESDHRLAFSLHLLAQDFVAEMFVPLKTDSTDGSLHTLGDCVNNACRPAALVNRFNPEIDVNVGETLALIPVDALL